MVRGRLGYVSYAKNALGLEFGAILSLTPPLRSQRWVATITCLGCTGTSKNKCSVALEAPAGVPSGTPVAGWGGRKPAKTRILAGFLAADGQASDYGGRLWSDCGADTCLPRVAHRHLAWPTPLGSASIKQLKTRILELFLHRRRPRKMRGKEPLCRRSLSTEMASGGGEGGGGRAKPPKTRVLARFWHGLFI